MTPSSPHGLLRWLQLQPQRAVGALAIVLAVVLCALVASDLQRDYEQQVAAANSRTSSLAQLLEEHARQSMRRVELALSVAAQGVQAQYQATGKVSAATGVGLRDYLPQDGLISSLAVLDESGKTLASTLTEAVADLPLADDRDFVMDHQQAQHNGLFVGQAVKSSISGLWIIPVSIRLQGGFNGYLMGAMDPEYFQRLYQSIDVDDNGFVALFTSRGWAVARWPFSSEIAERNWLDAPMFRNEISKASAAVVWQKVAATGIDSVYSYRALQDFPLIVVLGIARDGVLQPWRERALFEGSALLLTLLFLGAATALLIAQLRRRLQAEAALQLSEISLLKSSLPTLWVGPDARVLRVNQAACDLHGRSQEEMLKSTVPDLSPGMTLDKWAGHWERLRKARNMHFETVHRTGQGQDVPVEVELNFIEFQGQEFNFAFVRDLSVRKQAEDEIRRGAALVRSAIDAVDEAFVLFDADDRMVYCNAKYTQLYPGMEDVVVPGARFEDMIRAGAQRGLYRESTGREEQWVAERMQAHRQGNETRIQKRDDGRVLRVIDRRTPEGNIAGIRVDITDMVKATEEAQEASRYKSQFLANMSHEIRTPMNAILGLLSLLQNTALTNTQRDYAAKTEGAAQSLLHLLNDILDFSKVEAGKMELDPQPLRLDRLLRNIAVILSSNMAGKSIEVLFDIDPEVPAMVVADAMRLQQVLVNLGGNAIKFTAVGQVVLRVHQLARQEAGAGPQVALEFSIQDSGIGIPPEQQEHIFTGFSQAEASTTRRFGGTGLGLAISRRLVELMGARLSLHSVVGEGSTFSFSLCLPLVPGQVLAAQEALRLSVEPKRVLVVDDNPVAREILSAMTRSWSWPTELAASGLQALEMCRSQVDGAGLAFDVVYLDWQMPGMDGWECARQLRELCQGQALRPRLVMLSANSQDTLQLRTLTEQSLIDAFLFKPVTASALQDAALAAAPQSLESPPAQRSSQRQLAGMRILVVEDNLINQQVAEELLGAEGALVSLAANGQLGVDAVAVAQAAFDVVLMDIQMPVLDGFGATRKIREELGLKTLPIVAMTANAMASDRTACLQAGMNEHVGKPFDMGHLVKTLLGITGRPLGEQPVQPVQAVPVAAEAEAASSSPYLDVGPALERISGLTELYVDIGREFLLALDAVEADFRRALQADETATLRAQMHTLKGTSATLGAVRLSQQAAALEQLFKLAQPGLDPASQLPGLLDVVAHTRTAMVQALASMQQQTPDTSPGLVQAAAGPAERAQASAYLQRLAALLAASNLAALDHFAQRGTLLNVLPNDDLLSLQEALRGLDLNLAGQLCERFLAELA